MNDQDRAAQVWDVWERAWVTWNEAANKADPECNTKAVEILATYGQEQFRAGVEAVNQWLKEHSIKVDGMIKQLLAEQEKK